MDKSYLVVPELRRTEKLSEMPTSERHARCTKLTSRRDGVDCRRKLAFLNWVSPDS